MSRAEVSSLSRGLHSVRSPLAAAILPFLAFANPTVDQFNAEGTTALIAVLYLPGAITLLMLHRRGWMTADGWIVALILYMFVGYWILSSVTLRYATLFIPLLAVCLATTIGLLLQRLPWRGPVIAAIAAVTMIPAYGTTQYYLRTTATQFQDLPDLYLSDSQFQTDRAYGFREATFVANILKGRTGSGLVYVVAPGRGEDIHYYFRMNGILSAGSWVGPSSWFRLFDAIDAGEAPQFLSALHIRAVLIDPAKDYPGLRVPLERQLVSHGYCADAIPGSTFALYIQCASHEGRPALPA
jgi:hypothetical protein